MRNSGYASILKSDFPQFIVGKPDASFKGCKAISQLYCDQSNRERSTAQVRKLVAQQTGKLFLCDGNQQDSDEFLRSVISMMSIELDGWDVFSNMHRQHIGIENIKRKLLDNSSGVCSKCGEFPSSKNQEFLSLKLTIPVSDLPIDLASLVQNYFSESTQRVQMKCSSCCPHENPPNGHKVPCPQVGFCSRPSVSCC